MANFFRLNGVLQTEKDMTEDEFWNLFIDMIEEKEMCFYGVIKEEDEDEV